MTVAISLVLQSVVGVSGERPRSASEVNQYLNRNFFSYQRSLTTEKNLIAHPLFLEGWVFTNSARPDFVKSDFDDYFFTELVL
jgi:hypothetical protein